MRDIGQVSGVAQSSGGFNNGSGKQFGYSVLRLMIIVESGMGSNA